MKELVAKINAEFEAFTAETIFNWQRLLQEQRKSTLEMEKLLKEFRKLSIEESKNNSFYVKVLN
jgi:hypothetical protein